jgi:hypothetical protein
LITVINLLHCIVAGDNAHRRAHASACSIVAARRPHQVHEYLCDECDALSATIRATERADNASDTTFNSLINVGTVQQHLSDTSSPLHEVAAMLAFSAARAVNPGDAVV